MNSTKNKQTHNENFSFISERLDSQGSTISKVKAKNRLNLSLQIKVENKRRDLLSSSMQKLLRKDAMSEKIKRDIEKRRNKELQKKVAIEMRLKSLLHEQREKTQDWNRKLSRVSSRVSSITPRNKRQISVPSSSTHRLSKDIDYISLDQLRELNEKLEKKSTLHQSMLKETTSRLADHNEKVKKTLKTQISIREINDNSKLINLIEKVEDLESHRISNKKRIEDQFSKKLMKNSKRYSKQKLNKDEEEQKILTKVSRLENKKILQKNILMCQLEELNKEKEYKSVKQKLRDEDAKQNLARKRRFDLQKRDKILEKHLELHRKFLQMKDEKEKINEKIRYEAIQAMQEHMKAKELHLLITRSDNPNSVTKLLEKHY